MATPQQYIQSMAQQASPFVPNNGNPNTVYNTAATPFGGQAVDPWQNISAFGGTNIADHWSFAPAPTALPAGAYAAPANQFWNNMTELAPAQFNMNQSGASWPGGSNPFLPPPQEDWGIEEVIHPRDPISKPRPVGPTTGVGGPTTTSPGSGSPDGVTGNRGTYVPIHVGGSLGGESGTINSKSMGEIESGLSGLADSISRGLGFNGRDGKFDPMQFLDAITEIVIPGDFYNANVGSINWPNAVKGALNAVVPGLGRVAEWLAGKLPDGNPIKEWLQRGQLQNLVDEAYEPKSYMNAPQTSYSGGGVGGGGGGGGGSWNDFGAPVFDWNNPGPDRFGVVGGISAA